MVTGNSLALMVDVLTTVSAVMDMMTVAMEVTKEDAVSTSHCTYHPGSDSCKKQSLRNTLCNPGVSSLVFR